MLPEELREHLESKLDAHLTGVRRLSGGDIHRAAALQTAGGEQYFIKFNAPDAAPMFQTEAKGLSLMAATGAIRVPQVVSYGENGEHAYLILQLIKEARPCRSVWRTFGEELARLHRSTSDQFGLDHDNYIGSLEQSNREHTRWAEFYQSERLAPQIHRATGILGKENLSLLEKLVSRLPEHFAHDPRPSLIHGDLWGGNFLIDANGAWLIDPAVYYGDREVDLAMSRLFGGFSAEFYEGYEEEWPLPAGWQERIDLYQLYYLLVHVNLFGSSYLPSVMRIVRQYS